MTLARIVLSSGRRLKLYELHLRSTYGGMLEGYPMARINDPMVAGMADRARRLFPRVPVHVEEPQRYEPPVDPQERWPFGPPQWLPAVTCVGAFSSDPTDPGLDPVLHESRLVIAWFQSEPTVPADGWTLPTLRWDEQAEDHEL